MSGKHRDTVLSIGHSVAVKCQCFLCWQRASGLQHTPQSGLQHCIGECGEVRDGLLCADRAQHGGTHAVSHTVRPTNRPVCVCVCVYERESVCVCQPLRQEVSGRWRIE